MNTHQGSLTIYWSTSLVDFILFSCELRGEQNLDFLKEYVVFHLDLFIPCFNSLFLNQTLFLNQVVIKTHLLTYTSTWGFSSHVSQLFKSTRFRPKL